MKKLLLLGGSRYLIPVIKKAQELGVYVITCDYLPDNIGHQYSNEYHNVSIVDREAVLILAKSLKIDGVLSFATDPGVVTAAYIAEEMEIPGCPLKSVEILQNKDLFRNFLKGNGFQVPRAEVCETLELAMIIAHEMDFPIMVKPTDSAGSKGVSRVNVLAEIERAYLYAKKYSRTGKVILEEFIAQEGFASGSDCFSVGNELVFSSFDCQYFDENAKNPYTPAAHRWPSDMPISVQDELAVELQRLIRLLHLGTSIYNIETRLGKDGIPYIMEVSPRGGGNRLSEVLKMASGVDLIECSIRGALGMDLPKLSHPVYDGIWAEVILHANKVGVFEGLEISDEIREKYLIEEDLWVKKGDVVNTFTGANETIGTLVFRFSSIEKAKKYIEQMIENPPIRVNE